MNEPLEIVLVGAGAIGGIVARDIYPRMEGVAEIRAVVDPDETKAERLARVLGVPHYRSLDKVPSSMRYDAVDIRVPPMAHVEIAVDGLRRGKHILVEKPLALGLAECHYLVDVAAKSGCTVAVAENYPHLLSVQSAKAAITRGEIGQLLAIQTTRAFNLAGVWATSPWRTTVGRGSALLWDQGTHHASLVRCIGGEVISAYATAVPPRENSPAEAVSVSLELESGSIAQMLFCWGPPLLKVETEAQLFGTSGRISVSVSYERDQGIASIAAGGNQFTALCEPEGYYASHEQIIADWVDAINQERDPLVPLASATADIAVLLASVASLRDARRVDLPRAIRA